MSGITTICDRFDFVGTELATVSDAVDLLFRGGVNCVGAFIGHTDDGLALVELTFATRNLPRVNNILAGSLV